MFVAGPQGCRRAWTTAIYSPANDALRWWVGCQNGITTDQLRSRVDREHGASAHGDDYRALIDFVVSHPGLKRAMAQAAAKAA